jgi:hypothetical protein
VDFGRTLNGANLREVARHGRGDGEKVETWGQSRRIQLIKKSKNLIQALHCANSTMDAQNATIDECANRQAVKQVLKLVENNFCALTRNQKQGERWQIKLDRGRF